MHTLKHAYKMVHTRFLNEDEHNMFSPISLEVINSTCSSNPNMARHIVIDGNTLIFPIGSCLEFYNFFQSNKVFLASANLSLDDLNQQIDSDNNSQYNNSFVEYETVGIAGNRLGKYQIVVASQMKARKDSLFISKYSANDTYAPSFKITFPITQSKELMQIQLIDILYYSQNSIIIAIKVYSPNSPSECTYKVLTITLQSGSYPPKIILKYQTKCHKVRRLLVLEENIGVILQKGISILVNQQFIIPNSLLPIETTLKYKDLSILDYYELENELKIVLHETTQSEQYLECQWASNYKTYKVRVQDYAEDCHLKNTQVRVHRLLKINKNILLAHRNTITITHLLIDEDGFKFVANYSYMDFIEKASMEKSGIADIQVSQDQMHIILTAELVEKSSKTKKIESLIFNLSTTTGGRKHNNIFMRIMPCATQSGGFKCMESTLSSHSYMLIGSKITSFQYLNSQPSHSSPLITPFAIHENPKSMTTHPLGHQFVVIFDNVIRFYNKINSVTDSTPNKNSERDSEALNVIEDTGVELVEVWSEQYNCCAAKYSQSGALALCCHEDSFIKIILYDTYKFKSVKVIPAFPMHSNGRFIVNRMQWCSGAIKIYIGSSNKNSESLRNSSQMVMVNLYDGNKIREFRNRENKLTKFKINFTDYCWDSDRLLASATLRIEKPDMIRAKMNKELGYEEKHTNFLIYSSRQSESHDNSLSNHRIVFMPEGITFIKICLSLRTVFLGGQNGHLYWTVYPLQLRSVDYYSISSPTSSFYEIIPQELHKVHLSSNPITAIELTSNNKFLIVNIKDHGYFTFKVRRLQNHKSQNNSKIQTNSNMNLVFQELGNPIFNTIVTISTGSFTIKKELLKTLLEKRKSCFTDLEEFRKEFQAKQQQIFAELSKANKQKQLCQVSQELEVIQSLKQEKAKLIAKQEEMEDKYQRIKDEEIKNCEKGLLQLYHRQDQEMLVLKQNRARYAKISEDSQKQCDDNINDIDQDLKGKYDEFQSQYRLMIKNLNKFEQRVKFQNQLQEQENQTELRNFEQRLKLSEQSTKQRINSLSLAISNLKKNNERLRFRKGFMQYRKTTFEEQKYLNQEQYDKLMDLKQQLQHQLHLLQNKTLKKQNTLKNLLNINTSLNKYKQIHEGFIDMGVKQIKEIKDTKQQCEEQIKQIMAELIEVSKENSQMKKVIKEEAAVVKESKLELVGLSNKIIEYGRFIDKIMKDIQYHSGIEDNKEKEENMKKIYEEHFVKGNLEKMLMEDEDEIDKNNQQHDQDNEAEDQKVSEEAQKILQQLKDHKGYILNNFKLLETYNNRIKEEINLNFLRIQSQNYDLIAECNTRKDETVKKKRLLHELIDSVKETQIYLDDVKKDPKTTPDATGQNIMPSHIDVEQQINTEASKGPTFQTNHYSRVKTAVRKNTPKPEARLSTAILNKQRNTHINTDIKKKPGSSKTRDTPFVIFQRNKKQQEEKQSTHSRINLIPRCQVRKLLDIKNCIGGDEPSEHKYSRRIQTAIHRYTTKNQNKNMLETPVERQGLQIMKPMTAKVQGVNSRSWMKNGRNLNKANKSASKPTTAYTCSKLSVAI